MRWPGASPLRKKLASCAICWMNMKEAGNDHLDELVLPQRDAIFGMGSVAFSLAGNCARRCGRVGDGVVPSRVGALSAGRCCPRANGAGSIDDFLVLFAATFQCGRNHEVVAARRGSLVHSEGQNRGEWLGATFLSRAVAGCASVAGRGLAAR